MAWTSWIEGLELWIIMKHLLSIHHVKGDNKAKKQGDGGWMPIVNLPLKCPSLWSWCMLFNFLQYEVVGAPFEYPSLR